MNDFQPSRSGFKKLEEFNLLATADKLRYFCLLGHLAPSSHNTQPWKFAISESDFSITVYLNRELALPASDVAGRQAVISIGCAVENIIIGARWGGYTASVEILTNDTKLAKPTAEPEQKLIPMAKIIFTKADPDAQTEPLVRAIFDRKIVRAEYDPTKQISADTLESIKRMADSDTTELHLITDTARRLAVAEFQSQADAYVINSPKFSKELGDWLLPNDSTNRLGMPGITFGLPDDEALRLHNGLTGKSPLQPEDGLKFATNGKIFIEKSPLIGVITTKYDDIENWIMAGRLFEQICLEFTCQGIHMAIHAGVTEVPLVKKIFGLSLGTTRYITFLFRAGYVRKKEDAMRPHSPRLPLEEMFTADTP